MINKTIANRFSVKNFLTMGIALVWLINGLICKLLNLVPRHQMIVSRILGEDYSNIATKTIGISEIFMSIWIISKIKSRFCALTQIVVIATMNIIEFILAPDLLLFGKFNSIVAIIFILIIFINEFFISNPEVKNS